MNPQDKLISAIKTNVEQLKKHADWDLFKKTHGEIADKVDPRIISYLASCQKIGEELGQKRVERSGFRFARI